MADTYKILYGALLGNAATPASVYSPGLAKQAIIKNITVHNTGANTEIVQFYINGQTQAFQWGPDITLAPDGSDGHASEWDGTLPLANTDTLYANSTDSSAVGCFVSGDEIS
jgi:hypothetical protein